MNEKLITRGIYRAVVEEPASQGFDEFCILSGYISSAFINQLRFGSAPEKNSSSNIFEGLPEAVSCKAIYGMYSTDGLTRRDHRQFCDCTGDSRFQVMYYNAAGVYIPRNCHSKIYLWMQNGLPKQAFCGSANATSKGFFVDDREAIAPCDPALALEYWKRFENQSTLSTDLKELNERHFDIRVEAKRLIPNLDIASLDFVDLPLTQNGRGLKIHEHSGLNWGQRDKRDGNQAYLPVPSPIAKKKFFPPRGVRCTFFTSDGEQFECVVAQDGEKAIHSVPSNADIGSYFRRVLKVNDKAKVHLEDLQRYGRQTVRIFKLPQGEYLLDYRPL